MTRFRQYEMTAGQWAAQNVVLLKGEIGWESGSPAKAKKGDGVTPWNSLPYAIKEGVPFDSPAFTGNPTAPTPSAEDDDTSIATTGFVKDQGYAPLNSPVLTGNPTAPTPATNDNDTSIATTQFVKTQAYAPLASPTFTGSPTAPTPPTNDNDTSIATTQFVKSALAAMPTPAGVDLVTPMLADNQTMFFAHRGAHNLYPENSMEGVRAVIKDNFAAEVDLRILSTGQPVLLHDATIDRTMDGTGTVANMTLAQWRARRILPQLPGGKKALPVEWDQLLTEVGGRGILLPELNVIGSGAPMIDKVVQRGLQRAVIFQCDSIADMQAVTNAGCACLLLVPAVNQVLSSAYPGWTHAQVKAAGVEFIGYYTTATQAELNSAIAAGLKVIIYTVNTAAELTAQLAKGAHGVFTDDPWHVSGRYAPRNEDPFRDGDAWPHLAGREVGGTELTPDQMASYFRFAPPGKLRSLAGTNSKQFHIAMGWAGQARGPNLRVRFTATYLEAAIEQGRFVGVFIGTQTSPDTVFADAALAGQNGYHFIARRTGVIAAYRVAPNTAPAALATSAAPGSPLAAANARSQPIRFEVNITATGVTFTNLTSGLTVTSTDTAYRGPCRIDFSTGGTDVEIEDIGVEEL